MSEIDETVEPEVDEAPKPKKAAKKAAPKSDAPAGLPHYIKSSMATTPEWDHDEFFALFADAEVPEWSEPGDLSRFSIEAFTASVGWVDRASHGTIRMLGQGVTEHSVDLDAVGGVCQGFQRQEVP